VRFGPEEGLQKIIQNKNMTIWMGISKDGRMPAVESCGVLVIHNSPGGPRFLALTRKHGGLDLPKGHREDSDQGRRHTALRELFEETQLTADDLDISEEVLHEESYFPKYKRLNGRRVQKTVYFFLATIKPIALAKIRVSQEHRAFQWLSLHDPQISANKTIRNVVDKVKI
jgi:8-oxo-dGTP pyrophosphatase MutT (NUDIX family)